MAAVASPSRSRSTWRAWTGNPSVLLLLMVAFLMMGCDENILNGIEEREAVKILAVLDKHGIKGNKELHDEDENLWKINVPSSQINRAYGILDQFNLPKPDLPGTTDILGQKMVTSPEEIDALSKVAQQNDIAQALQGIEGIISANVQIALPERDLGNRSLGEVKASVMVQYQPTSEGFAPVSDVAIQRFVAGSIDGLSPDRVTVEQTGMEIAAPPLGAGTDQNMVRVGPLIIQDSTLNALKLMIASAVLLIAGLGMVVFWQSRVIEDLRIELKGSRTDLVKAKKKASDRPARPAA